MEEKIEKSVFEILNSIDVSKKTKKKKNLNYLSWAYAWEVVKKHFPSATYKVYERTTEEGYLVNYFTDGKTAWVKTGSIVDGMEYIEQLPVMNFSNKSIPLKDITSFDVNKTIQRSITKGFARHGLGLNIYIGEDLPEDPNTVKKITKRQTDDIKRYIETYGKQNIAPYIGKNIKLSELTKDKAEEILSALDHSTETLRTQLEMQKEGDKNA